MRSCWSIAAEACGTWCISRRFHTWLFYMGLVPQPPICGVCTHFLIFLDTQQKGVRDGIYRNYVVRGSVVNSSSTLPSSELSTQGLLFNSCGSVGNGGQKTGKVLEKRGSLKEGFCQKWTLKKTQNPTTKPQNVPRSAHLSPTPLLP